VDISAKMLDQARMKIEQMGGSGRATFIQADLCDLSALPAGGAALAIALGDPIGCTPSPALALKQICRVLTDDGVLVATFDRLARSTLPFSAMRTPWPVSRWKNELAAKDAIGGLGSRVRSW
jgi:ubiquinone/menaquinone biosynthesis C-methylase UbiE